ncbi:MAG: carboxypeptidase regulatory-like domain-containing protein [Myxococcaceae bacterium]|nr:carboxypeptidase regulatory-like domain-containing protein [Myxococcaceae bacterium]
MKNRALPLLLSAVLGVAAFIVLLVRHPGRLEDAVEREPAAAPAAESRAAPAAPLTPQPSGPAREPAPQAPTGELDGHVISSFTREGIEGAELTWSSPRGAHSARSGVGGRFTFRPPEPGTYQLASATADGYLSFGPEWGKSPVSVTFEAGERVRGVTVELDPAPKLVGRVVDVKGQPVPGATARVLVDRADELALFPIAERFTADERGEVHFQAAPYSTLEAFHESHGSGSERIEPGAKNVTVTLEPWPLDAGPRVSLTGRVRFMGAAAAGARVRVASALSAFPKVYGAQDGYRGLTDDEGHFELTDLTPGLYDVSAHLLGTAPAHQFDVAVPSVKPLVLELGSGPKLFGRVSDETGASVPAFSVQLAWRKAPLERLVVVEMHVVDPNGRYQIDGVAPGDYALEVRALGFVPGAAGASLQAGRDTELNVTLGRGVRAAGTVHTEGTGRPVPSARVGIEGRDDAVTVTDSTGAFVLDGVPPGGFSLQAAAAGHNTKVMGVTEPRAPISVELSALAPDAGPKTELVGLGLVLRGRGDALVVGLVMPGAGGDAAGVKLGDEVVGVDGRPVAELGFEPAIRAIRGPAGSTVELKLRDRTVTAVRKKISN